MAMGLRGLHASIRPYAEYAHAIARANGINPVVTSTFRDWNEQKRLWQRAQEGRSNFPANPPGQSAHNWGLAWDSWVPEDQRATWTAIREYVGFRVPASDWIHAAPPNWRTWVGLA